MAADTKRSNLQTSSARRHSLHRKAHTSFILLNIHIQVLSRARVIVVEP
jgi:hypothetical protein